MSRIHTRWRLMVAVAVAAVSAVALGMPMAATAAPQNGDPCSPFWTQATASSPAFTFAPPAPLTQVLVAFDGSASQPGTANKWTFVSGDNACEPTSVETDPISSYKWDFGDGSPPQTAATSSASHTYAHPGQYTVTLTVTEANCQGGSNAHCFTNSIAHNVTIGNRLPAASFTQPAEVSVGQPANFDASASSDADGSIVNYHWEFGDGHAQDTTTPTTSHSYGSLGSKTVTLTVTDDSGGTAQVQHFLSVVNRPPTAAFNAPAEVTTAQMASFDASASTDADGAIVSYHWDFGDGQTQTTTSPTTAHTYGSPGSRLVTLTVTDNDGGTGQAQHTLAVLARSPLAAFSAPASVAQGQAAHFDASASADPDGTIVDYHWNFGDGHVQDSSAPATSHTYGSSGSKTVTLTITDSAGATAQATHHVSVVSQSGRCVVPRLLGKRVRGARKLLGRHGCRLGKVRHKHVHGHKHGRIVRQAPKAGTVRPAGSAVGVTVAR